MMFFRAYLAQKSGRLIFEFIAFILIKDFLSNLFRIFVLANQ